MILMMMMMKTISLIKIKDNLLFRDRQIRSTFNDWLRRQPLPSHFFFFFFFFLVI
jgi:hypothetical protein